MASSSGCSGYWQKWELFLGREFIAEDARLEHVDQLRNALRRKGLAAGHVPRTIRLVKTVYGWAERRELLARNRLAGYRFKRAKDERDVPPPEYSVQERERLSTALSPHRADQWRPWMAVTIAAHQGARMNAILHLRWVDVDLDSRTIVWRARWDKTGREWRQPLTEAAAGALGIAWVWRERDAYAGLGCSTQVTRASASWATTRGRFTIRRRSYGRSGSRKLGPVLPIAPTEACMASAVRSRGTWRGRRESEARHGVHRRYRHPASAGGHPNPARPPQGAASVMDRDRSDRPQTVPEPEAAAEPGLEVVGAVGPTELPRQDSNLRPAG